MKLLSMVCILTLLVQSACACLSVSSSLYANYSKWKVVNNMPIVGNSRGRFFLRKRNCFLLAVCCIAGFSLKSGRAAFHRSIVRELL